MGYRALQPRNDWYLDLETPPYRLEIDARHEPFRGGKPQGCVTQSQLGGCLKLGKVREVVLDRFDRIKP